MKLSAQQIADMLGGTVEGSASAEVWKLCKIEEGEEGGISFLANSKYTHYIYGTKASVVIVARDFEPQQAVGATLVRVDNPYLAFASLLKAYNDMQLDKKGISPQAFVSPTATVGEDCYIGPFAFVGDNARIGSNVKIYPSAYVGDNCEVGAGTTLFSGVRLYSNTMVGASCILHAGVVAGADGFGFAPRADGTYDKIDQIGNVVIEDDVEVGANTCIDRATMGSTVIRRGTKIDNLCQVAHNVVIGSNTVMASQSGVAGSGRVGSNCVIAGQVGVVGHIEVGDRVKIGAKSGVTRNVASDSTVWGIPAGEARQQKRNTVYLRNIEQLVKRVEELEKIVRQK